MSNRVGKHIHDSDAKARRAYELHRKGLDTQTIAERLGLSRSWVQGRIKILRDQELGQ